MTQTKPEPESVSIISSTIPTITKPLRFNSQNTGFYTTLQWPVQPVGV